jgi:hypothetical protein
MFLKISFEDSTSDWIHMVFFSTKTSGHMLVLNKQVTVRIINSILKLHFFEPNLLDWLVVNAQAVVNFEVLVVVKMILGLLG